MDVLAKNLGPRQKMFHFAQKVGRSLLKSFTDKFRTSHGPEAESMIAQDNEEIRKNRQDLREAERQLKEESWRGDS